jgi:MFS family permease
MLFRFCLYGFLKNQRYFEPFLILVFRQKGLSFATIGVLIGFREICINLMEIPTGAVADVMGHRRSMIASFLAYIGSFLVFGLCDPLWALFAAMLLFAVGEAFRTGTHKAIIFDWLKRQDRLSEKTAIYGRTRSWSELGSAASVVIAAGLVFCTQQYSAVFLFCVIPYALGIVNFLGYPAYLDAAEQDEQQQAGGVVRTLLAAISQCLRHRRLRRLLIEAMGYEGLYKSSEDYVQPVIQAASLSLPIMLAMGAEQRVTILVGGVYFLLYVLSSFASRGADRFAKASGGEDRAARGLWLLNLLVFVAMAAAIGLGLAAVAILAFVLLAVFYNLWPPTPSRHRWPPC